MKNIFFLLLTFLTAVLASPASIPDQSLKKRDDMPPFRDDDLCFSDPYGSIIANCDQCSCDEGWKPVKAYGRDYPELWCKLDDGNGGPKWYGPVITGIFDNMCPELKLDGATLVEGEENPPELPDDE
ncbi:MAG: hypothetical protein Q9180_007566 [Flavoplaca navasiana]